MNKTLCSIIIPNYNGAKFVCETIDSVLKQTYKNFEIIIVDDGSSDSSPQIIRNYIDKDNRIKLYHRNTKNKGASVCRNIGIEKSTGDYIIFLDSDDILSETCIEKRIQIMQNSPSLDFAVFNMAVFHAILGDTDITINKYSEKNEYLKMFIEYNLPWAITCPIWQASFLKKNDIRFDERYQRLQDPEFHAKILMKFSPEFMVLRNQKSDCFYRLPQTGKALKPLNPLVVDSFKQYYSDIKELDKAKNFENELNNYVINSLHSILFFNKLNTFTPIANYLNFLEIKAKNKIMYYFFYLCNKFGLTFKKGFGVSRLWNMLSKKRS